MPGVTFTGHLNKLPYRRHHLDTTKYTENLFFYKVECGFLCILQFIGENPSILTDLIPSQTNAGCTRSTSISNSPKKTKDHPSIPTKGLTGSNTNRSSLQALLQDVRDGLIDAIVVYQLNRLSRDVRDFANIYAVLGGKHVMFISIKENIDTTTSRHLI